MQVLILGISFILVLLHALVVALYVIRKGI